MFPTVFKKSDLWKYIPHEKPFTVSPKVEKEIINHYDLVSARIGDPEKFIPQLIQVLVFENPAWSQDLDLYEELKKFFLAVRSGNAEPKGNNAVAYADAYRTWRRTTNVPQAPKPDAFAKKQVSPVFEKRAEQYPDLLFHANGDIFAHSECLELCEIGNALGSEDASEFIRKAAETLIFHEKRGTVYAKQPKTKFNADDVQEDHLTGFNYSEDPASGVRTYYR